MKIMQRTPYRKVLFLYFFTLFVASASSAFAAEGAPACGSEISFVATPSSATATTPSLPVRTRLSWESFIAGPGGPARVASLQRAVAKMKSFDHLRGSTDPADQKNYMRSWEYWANIHGFFGTQSMSGTVEGFVSQLKTSQPPIPQVVIDSFSGLIDQVVPQDGVAPKVWGTCQHSRPKSDGSWNQANFWGWHRIYLYYFERVLQWAADDPTLSLPYWDYTNTAYLALPLPYRKLASSLYEQRRADGYNQGGKLPADDTDADQYLVNPDFLAAELGVETNVHGNVHCDVGGAANGCPQAFMGKVPVAGNDPIFYSHHANIDRLWSCWTSMHGAPQPGGWMDQSFSFPDETGNLRTRKVLEFLSTEDVGYKYEKETNCLRAPKRTPLRTALLQQAPQASQAAGPVVLGSAAGIPLTQATTKVRVGVARTALLSLGTTATPKTTVLVLKGVSAQSSPGPVLRVYVEATGKPSLRKLVGTVNWFTSFEHEAGPETRDITFDITRAVKSLGVGASGVTVTFQASQGVDLPAGRTALRSASPNAPAFNPASKLTIGSIQIEQVPVQQ